MTSRILQHSYHATLGIDPSEIFWGALENLKQIKCVQLDYTHA